MPIIMPQINPTPISNFPFKKLLTDSLSFRIFIHPQEQFWGVSHPKKFSLSRGTCVSKPLTKRQLAQASSKCALLLQPYTSPEALFSPSNAYKSDLAIARARTHTHNIGSISPPTRKPIYRKTQRIIHISDLKLHFCTKTIRIRFSYWSYISMPQIFHFKIVKIYLEQPGYFMISFLILKKKKKKKKKKKT